MTNDERCEELREALNAVRGGITPPTQQAVVHGAGGVVMVDSVITEPQPDTDTHKEIRALEQALRDEGCEPD